MVSNSYKDNITGDPDDGGEAIERKAFDGERVEDDESPVEDVYSPVFLDQSSCLLGVSEDRLSHPEWVI